MSQENVSCKWNGNPISVQLNQSDGTKLNFTIPAGKALIDDNNCIRLFTIDFDNGTSTTLKLHPFYSKTQRGILWIVDFLAGYGLSRVGGKLIKARGTPAQQEITNISRYFTFSNPGGTTIRSFIGSHFLPEHLGYHDIMTDELVFDAPLYVGK